jgi:hypothetical protein
LRSERYGEVKYVDIAIQGFWQTSARPKRLRMLQDLLKVSNYKSEYVKAPLRQQGSHTSEQDRQLQWFLKRRQMRTMKVLSISLELTRAWR